MTDSPTSSPQNSPFQKLIPDCRKLILSFHMHTIRATDLPSRQKTPPTSEFISDLEFAMKYLKCEAVVRSDSLNELPFLSNLYSWSAVGTCHNYNVFSRFRNLRELYIMDNGDFTNEIFQHLGTLEYLNIRGAGHARHSFTDEMLTHLKHLRKLNIINCKSLTDQAFENLHKAGIELEALCIIGFSQLTNRALSFFHGESMRELEIAHCTHISAEGLKHFRGVEQLSLNRVNMENFYNVFKNLEGSIQHLKICNCSIPFFDEKAMSTLQGISRLELQRVHIGNITNSGFSHLSGSIKWLQIYMCTGTERLTKNLLWHLSGIEHVDLVDTGFTIESRDLPRLKGVFSNVRFCSVPSNFAKKPTMKKLQDFIEGNGGDFFVSFE